MNDDAPVEDWVTVEAVIRGRTGLHARPAVKLTKLAKTFAARVEVQVQGAARWVNAKSPSSVMKLRAGHRAVLTIRATGDDALAAVEAISALVEANFHETTSQ